MGRIRRADRESVSGERIPGVWARVWMCFWVWVAAGLGTTAGFAARWVPLTIEQLAAAAGLVVHARVAAIETARDAEGRIFTRVELEVREIWKGSWAGGPCEFVAGGGILGDRAEANDAQARYEPGEELVAYLIRNPAGEWVTLGMAQGRFRVRSGPEGGRWVSNPFWGEDRGSEAGPESGVDSKQVGGGMRLPTRRPLALEELRRRTREVAP